jgi:hypothetical protein
MRCSPPALRPVVLLMGLASLGTLVLLPCQAQQVYRNGFESDHTSWVKGSADADYTEAVHDRTNLAAHDGQRCEHLRLFARQGSHIYYQLPTKRAPISEELSIGLWVKSTRPGVKFLARVVLPNERDPYSLDDRLTALIQGDAYRLTDRWQCLHIARTVALCQQQQNFMQNRLKKPLNFKDAYIDMLILNVYGGPGENEVWIDDLEMGPVLEDPPATAGKTPGTPTGLTRPSGRAAVVEFKGSNLWVNGKRFFFRGIRYSDTPLAALRNAGFNTLWLDAGTSPAVVRQAAELGFRLVPALPAGDDTHFVSTEGLSQEVSQFPETGEILGWDLGGSLTHRDRDLQGVMRTAQLVRSADPGRPLIGDAWDGLAPYARNVNMLGTHRWPLMTGLELPQYREWLEQRRQLAWQGQPGTFMWTWIQTQAPDWYTQVAYNQPAAAAFKEPIGPQPEQVRLMTYQAVAAGCRGLGFWSDRFLADSHQGRDRLLGVALVNQELEMLEPLLVTAEGPPAWIDTSIPEVKAAVFRTAEGVLVLPLWCGRGAQFVPGQAAVNKLTMVVPQVPQDMQAWEVTPGEVRGLMRKRVVGGTEVTVGEFGLSTAIVFTADILLVKRFQEQCHDLRQVASQWTYELALQELDKVVHVERMLEQDGHKLPDGPQLLKNAETRLRRAKEHWDNRLFSESYREAQRALRPMRILMRAQFDKATDPKALDTPVASPYAVSFFTLPRHWQLMDQVKASSPGANLLPGGGFEAEPSAVQASWQVEDLTLDPVEMKAVRVAQLEAGPKQALEKKTEKQTPAGKEKGKEKKLDLTQGAKEKDKASKKKVLPKAEVAPKEGKQCLMLRVTARNPALTPAILEGTYLAITSPPVSLTPGSLVQVSCWVTIPVPLTGSVDGALFYDSAGGEPLAIRLRETMPWKKFTLYRRVPADGKLRVTLALTGMGTVYFDDVRVEPLNPGVTTTTTVARPTTTR